MQCNTLRDQRQRIGKDLVAGQTFWAMCKNTQLCWEGLLA